MIFRYSVYEHKAIVHNRLRPQCAIHDDNLLVFIIESRIWSICRRLLCVSCSVAARNTHNAPYGHYVKTWRHPQNRKYITYRNAAKLRVIRTDKQTYSLLAVLHIIRWQQCKCINHSPAQHCNVCIVREFFRTIWILENGQSSIVSLRVITKWNWEYRNRVQYEQLLWSVSANWLLLSECRDRTASVRVCCVYRATPIIGNVYPAVWNEGRSRLVGDMSP